MTEKTTDTATEANSAASTEQPIIDDTIITAGSLSRSLKKCREAADMDLKQAADEMRLPLHVLKALEAEEFANLPEPPYIRGYLRSYSRLNDSDPNELIRRYEVLRGASPDDMASFAPGMPLNRSSANKPTVSPATVKLAGLALMVLVLGVLSMIPAVSQWVDETWRSFSEQTDQQQLATEENANAEQAIQEQVATEDNVAQNQDTVAENTATTGENGNSTVSNNDTATPDNEQLALNSQDNTVAGEAANATSSEEGATTTNTGTDNQPEENTTITDASTATDSNQQTAAQETGTGTATQAENLAIMEAADRAAEEEKKAEEEAAALKLAEEKKAEEEATALKLAEEKKAEEEVAALKLAEEKKAEEEAKMLAEAEAAKKEQEKKDDFQQPIEGTVNVQLVFSESVWMSIKDQKGKNVFASLNGPGTRKQLKARTPLMFRVGNAPGVKIYLNGQLVDQKPYTRGSVSQFRIR